MATDYEPLPEDKSAWSEYGPPVLGALIILAVLAGGWYFWRLRSASQESQEVAQVEQVEEQEASPSPTPLPEQEAQAAEAPEVEVAMGGPEELPATGFPVGAAAAISLLAIAAGWKLRKLRA